MDEIKLKAAGTAEVPLLSELARRIWLQHYTHIISKEQIEYMLQKMYSKESLEDQILVKQHRFFLIQHYSEIIGFLSVFNESGSDWFLSKFYIDQNFSRKGYGQLAFGQILKILNPEKMQLTVNRQNYKAINFYFKIGFRIRDVADFDIGMGFFMNDFVMEWSAKQHKKTHI